MSLKDLSRNKWVKLGFWSVLYVAWVVWLGNYWWLFGLAVIFDVFISKKVNWTFWKKREYKEGEKPGVLIEWIDAIIFAVVVVTFINMFFFQAFKIPSSSMESTLYTGDHLFVGKLAYGPRVPETPLTIPFTHNVLPGGGKSYSTLIKNDYRRLKGFGNVKRGDCVVFGFPNGDTVLTKRPSEDYYAWVRQAGREYVIDNFGPVMVHPMDKKDHYVKRCVAVAGDTLEVIDGIVYVNGAQEPFYKGRQTSYTIRTNGQKINPKNLEKLGINISEIWYDQYLPGYQALPLTDSMVEEIKSYSNVVSVEKNIDSFPPDYPDSYLSIFPYMEELGWTRDNYGPIWIPKKGESVRIDANNLPFYERLITSYEHNTLEVGPHGKILINGEETKSYTFKQDYFFMMGDNRHNSLDSRYWGFVPEDHIVGKPRVIWFSSDRNYKFPNNVRWGRIFKFV